MEGEFELHPKAASTGAPLVDGLYFELVGITAFFTVLIAVLLLYLGIKYRRRSEDERPRPVAGSLRLELFWSAVPLVIVMYIFFRSASIFLTMVTPPDDALEIQVLGKQWMWELRHAQGQKEINYLHVPAGRPVKLTMTSQDVIHSFFVPAFRIKQDVVPGRWTTLWFEATTPGKYRLFCTEYCGTNHSTMIGTVEVMEPQAYQAWLEGQVDGALAAEGRKLFLKLQCQTCHSGDARAKAPLLEGVFGKQVPLDDGTTARADADYLEESIVNPRAKVVAGFKPIMPPYNKLAKDDLIALVAYLKSLGPGQTPPRVEKTAPPTEYVYPEVGKKK
jgi:cytochrome c oxidase subunit II